MTLTPAEAIFDLPYPNFKEIAPLNEILASAVAKALPRENATPKRRIAKTDGPVLSQYARVMGMRRITLRTLNIDLLQWFSDGLDSPLEVVLDSRVPPVLASAKINLAGNFKIISGEGLPSDRSAIFGDRMDIIAFADAICDDILSGRHACLLIYDVLDIAGRRLIDGAREAGIAVEVVPGPQSYGVFQIGGDESRNNLARFLRTYIKQTKIAPEFLYARLRSKSDAHHLTGAFGEALGWAWDACADANGRLGGKTHRRPAPKDGETFLEAARLMTAEFCAILDPANNPVAAISGREYRARANAINESLQHAQKAETDFAKIREPYYECYRLLWQFFQLVASWNKHSLADNETIRLAIESSAHFVIAPKAFKPFREYVFFYQFQDFEHRREKTNLPPRVIDRTMFRGSVNHVVRKWQLIGLIEMLFSFLRRERPNETIRWLDLGCGSGDAVNCIRIEHYLPDDNWEIVGVDWNKTALDIAKQCAGPRRTFLHGDVKEAIAHIGGGPFNIVSAFEVVEHLEDPVKTLKDYADLCSDFFVAGSPLSELQSWSPAAAHIWTFDREGYQAILNAAGLAPIFANEAHVGKFSKGHDWVTVIGSKTRNFASRI